MRARGQRESANEEKQHGLSRPPRSGSSAVARGRVSAKARGQRSTSRPRAGPDLREKVGVGCVGRRGGRGGGDAV